jgi:adenylate cyclase
MADVFLSYAHGRRGLAQALAEDLAAAGLSVWWDSGLGAHQQFRKEIDAQLDAASAVVVLWTPDAVDSIWVSAEADHALRQGKLVNTHAGELAPEQIPKPFNQIHSVGTDNSRAVIAAVQQIRQSVGARDGADPVQVRAALELPDRPSIAVLPFVNLSGDPSQEYFSDGITEDIVIELARFSELFVIARNSSFQYKGRSPDVRQVGRELGVRHVLEGSIRRSAGRVRITAQLIDATTGVHRWADRYDRDLNDVFAVQDEVARTIATILAAHMKKAEAERTLLKPPATWQAYDCYMRAADTLSTFLSSFRVDVLRDARRLLEQSLALDASYARAHAALSETYLHAYVHSLDEDHLQRSTLDQAYQLARRAVQLDANLPHAHAQLGWVLLYRSEHDASIAAFERCIALNPHFGDWQFGAALMFDGQAARAIRVLESHLRLDPFYEPFAPAWIGLAHYTLRQYSQALPFLHESVSRSPNFRGGHAWLAATYVRLGRGDEARAEAAEVLRIDPRYTIEGTQKPLMVFKRPEDAAHFFDSLRQAGLPER